MACKCDVLDEQTMRSILERYRYHIPSAPAEAIMDRVWLDKRDAISHLNSMLDRLENHLNEGRLGKAERWICFMQGVLCTLGVFTVDDLRAHNRG